MWRQRGVTLIEGLFVLAIIAVIMIVTIQHFQHYRRNNRLNIMRSDISAIKAALNRYFLQAGCTYNGVINNAAKLSPDIVADLGLAQKYQRAMPIITEFNTQIIESGQTKDNKPIYQLQLIATLNKSLSQQQMHWYQQALNAATLTNGKLYWNNLAGNSAAQGSDQLWVLHSSSKLVKQQFNANLLNNTASPSYCAH